MDHFTMAESESLRCVVSGLVIKMAANAGEPALIALHMDRSAVLIINDEEVHFLYSIRYSIRFKK